MFAHRSSRNVHFLFFCLSQVQPSVVSQFTFLFFVLFFDLARGFRSLHEIHSTHTHGEAHRNARAIDPIETTKRKQTTKIPFFALIVMSAESNAKLFFFSKRNEERLPKSFTFDGASVGNWMCIDVGAEHLHWNVQFGNWLTRGMWNSFEFTPRRVREWNERSVMRACAM